MQITKKRREWVPKTNSVYIYSHEKAAYIFSWLRWITLKGLPFSFVEDNLTAEYTTLKRITRQTLITYLEKLTP